MDKSQRNKILVHSCCGPCSIEPYRYLINNNWDPTLFFSNDNIVPYEEFLRRFDTLIKWANNNNITVIKDDYDNNRWAELINASIDTPPNSPSRKQRCSKCYSLRFKRSCAYAKANKFKFITTTLSVSPYQFTNEIKDTLNNIAQTYNLTPVFVDFRPMYKKAVISSKELGMYRQKYCGCGLSLKESNEILKNKELKKQQNKLRLEQQKINAQIHKKEIQAYMKRQKLKKKLLKEYKESQKHK